MKDYEQNKENLSERLERLRPVINKEIERVRGLVKEKDKINSEDFDLRGGLYRLAFEVAPEARQQDLVCLREWISPKSGEKAVDIAAGTGFLTIPLTLWTGSTTYAIDPSEVQLNNLNKKKGEKDIRTIVGSLADQATLEAVGKDVGNIDIVTSFGGLHHVIDKNGENNQRKLFENVSKLLKKGGRMVVGDVGADTILAKHFEVSVKNHCLTSHEEKWLSQERLQGELTEGTGLRYVKSEIVQEKWVFANEKQLALFMKCLHAYDMTDEEILSDLKHFLGYSVEKDGSCKLNWPMLFFSLTKE